METESKKPRGEFVPFTLSERKHLWWVVCTATTIVTFIVFQYISGANGAFIPLLIFSPLAVPFLPVGLSHSLSFPFQWIQDHYEHNNALGIVSALGELSVFPLAIAIFVGHWRLTLKTELTRPFLLLMLSLILLTVASLIGCSKMDLDFMPQQP